jgi:hypothetical protein
MPIKRYFDNMLYDAIDCDATEMINVSDKLLNPPRMIRRLPPQAMVDAATTFFEV